jgi:hypothetical protein
MYISRIGRPARCIYNVGDSVLFMDGKRKRRGRVTLLRPCGKQNCIEVVAKVKKKDTNFIVEFVDVVEHDPATTD